MPYTPQHPRSGHTCNAVGGSQILIVGGVDDNAPGYQGNSTKDLYTIFGTPDPFPQGLKIFDMHSWTFNDSYTAGLPLEYEQHDTVKQFYGQSQRYVILRDILTLLSEADNVYRSYTQHLLPGVAALVETMHFNGSSQCPRLLAWPVDYVIPLLTASHNSFYISVFIPIIARTRNNSRRCHRRRRRTCNRRGRSSALLPLKTKSEDAHVPTGESW